MLDRDDDGDGNPLNIAFDHNHNADVMLWQFLHLSRWGETNDLTIPKRLAARIIIASLDGLSYLFSEIPLNHHRDFTICSNWI